MRIRAKSGKEQGHLSICMKKTILEMNKEIKINGLRDIQGLKLNN